MFGFWQSHLGKRGSQAKLARSWTSEIVGYEPAADDVRQQGLKGDPLNLAKGEPVYYNDNDWVEWGLGKGSKGTKTDRLSKIGHGQVPVSGDEAAPAGVSFAAIEQRSTLSLAGLRRVWVGPSEANAAARAVVAADRIGPSVADAWFVQYRCGHVDTGCPAGVTSSSCGRTARSCRSSIRSGRDTDEPPTFEEHTRCRDETIYHALLDRTTPRWSLPHVQATLMARHRPDLDDYAPYLAQR